MEAICKPDYLARLKAKAEAEAALKLRKKQQERAQQLLRLAQKRGWKIKPNQHVKEEENSEAAVLVVGFYDVYGVWFHGRLFEALQQISLERFGVSLGDQSHVFIGIEPKKLADGIHELTVYGLPCRLYKWMAHGFHRGLVVLVDDEPGNAKAQVYLESRTWSWAI